jgi:hypothetical protein
MTLECQGKLLPPVSRRPRVRRRLALSPLHLLRHPTHFLSFHLGSVLQSYSQNRREWVADRTYQCEDVEKVNSLLVRDVSCVLETYLQIKDGAVFVVSVCSDHPRRWDSGEQAQVYFREQGESVSTRRNYGFFCASRHNSHMFISRRRGVMSV